MKKSVALRAFALSGMVAASLAAITPAHADSKFTTGAGAISAAPQLDFRVIIPKFIRFSVGTAVVGTVDLVEFSVLAANVGSGTDVARTNGGAVAVSLVSNGGNVTLTGTTTGALTDGTEDISFAEILSTSDNAQLAAPVLVDAGVSADVTVTPNIGTKVVSRTA
ncbi:MAG TPA: hypothetical protein PKY03_06585, partial [Moraxellaceae bacterium]|nr:hypothetical protein [Moraxellaceae bacterium]